jgi:hypothetical protein
MKHFTFDVFHANGTEELQERLNDAGLNGFEIKHVSRNERAPVESWVVVMQRETDMSDFDAEWAMEAHSPKGENL